MNIYLQLPGKRFAALIPLAFFQVFFLTERTQIHWLPIRTWAPGDMLSENLLTLKFSD